MEKMTSSRKPPIFFLCQYSFDNEPIIKIGSNDNFFDYFRVLDAKRTVFSVKPDCMISKNRVSLYCETFPTGTGPACVGIIKIKTLPIQPF